MNLVNKSPFILLAIIIIFLGAIFFKAVNNSTINTITAKVINLKEQQLISGAPQEITTDIRYLVITDKETFICESNILQGKFNNSDVFYHLQKDSTYTFEISGIGKTFLTDYRNILNIK